MQERHSNRELYFNEQIRTTEKYYIPYIRKYMERMPEEVLEIGCGEGGNLFPFAQSGCKVTGVDIVTSRIEQARSFFSERNQEGTFIASDIFKLKELQNKFSLILIHDVIEHIYDKTQFLSNIKDYLSSAGLIYIGFPGWQMPFGGHQQIARGRLISHCPFIHLLPASLYKSILQLFGEKEDVVKELLNIKRTKCTIEMFRRIAQQTGYRIINQELYFINPHYETKFGLKPRKLNKIIARIPYFRNIFSTSCFYILKPSDHNSE